MAEYLFQEETLTALADEVRELSGSTDKMSTDVMTSKLGEANVEVGNQADLIAQIKSVVDNLPEAGGGSQPETYDTCTIQINVGGGTLYGYAVTCFDGENIQFKTALQTINIGNTTITDVVCGSVISVFSRVTNGTYLSTHIEQLSAIPTFGFIGVAPSTNGSIGTLQIGDPRGAGGGE